jgi:TonB-dependent starch-binding outer membrane protein SusC
LQKWRYAVLKKYIFLSIIIYLQGLNAFSQIKISGYVTDRDEKLPLYPVTVLVKGTSLGTITDSNGYFHILAKKGSEIIFSYVGYETKAITVGNDSVLHITLRNAVSGLNEVVMTGYSTQRVKEITGSVTVVKGSDLTEVPTGQVESMMQGKVSGLTVINSGMPGAPSNVRLNGIGNFGNVTPLYIIDGVEADINNLNPDDIESIQVLKDAGAYAIYGVRGGNGVIIVTTKSGKNGKTRIHYNSYYGRTIPLKHGPALLSPQEEGYAKWEGYRNSGQVDGTTHNPVDAIYGSGPTPVIPDYIFAGPYTGLFDGDPRVSDSLYNIDYSKGNIYQIVASNKSGTDWFHELFHPANTQNHTLTVSGGNDRNKYLFSFGYLDQEGTLINTYLKRYTTRINTEYAVNNNIRIGENLQLSYRDNPQIVNQQEYGNNEIFAGLIIDPIYPVYDIKGGWAGLSPENGFSNPVAARNIAANNSSQDWDVLGNAFGELKFLKNFIAKTSFGGTYTNFYNYAYSFAYGAGGNGIPFNNLSENSGYSRSWTWTNTVNFSKTFNNTHSLKVLAGTETVNYYNRNQTGSTSGFFTNDPNYRFLSNGSNTQPIVSSTAGKTVLYSLISRLDYGYKDKIFISGTLRRDGASVFGDENRYAWFPSVSAAWRMTQEKFMNEIAWLNEFKIRASWGKTGYYGNTSPDNQYSLYGSSFATSYYDINGTSTSSVQGIRPLTIGDPKTGWQEDIITDIGLESTLWGGKLSITADWYKRESEGLLFQVTLPNVLGGASPPFENVGSVQNVGVNLMLGSKWVISTNWRWNATVTFSTYQSKIISLPNLPYFDTNVFTRNEVGYPIGSFYGLKVIGLFKDASDVAKSPAQLDAGPGRFKFLDGNGDGRIQQDSDRVHYGNPNPKFTLGINIGINFKGFDFSIFCYGSFGNDVYNVEKTIYDELGSGTALSKNALYNSWTPQHTNTLTPILESIQNFSNSPEVSGPNSYGLEKGTYFRNKSTELGYTFPKNFLSKYKIENIRIYIQALNLFTITSYSGLDPELSGTSSSWGVDWGNYPSNQKQYLFGLSLGF